MNMDIVMEMNSSRKRKKRSEDCLRKEQEYEKIERKKRSLLEEECKNS